MSKQYTCEFVSWRHAKKRPLGWLADESAYGRAAAEALEARLNQLAQEGWIVDTIMPAGGFRAKECAAYTVVAFK